MPHLSVKRARVRLVSRRLAEQIILKYEWLGTMAPTTWHYGIFFGNFCAGVTCVGRGVAVGGTNLHKPFSVDRSDLLVLARGANVHWSPLGANSKLVSWTCRLLAKDANAKLVIAYSDTDAGEIGTIYQACNWFYIGRGASTTQYVAPNGVIRDQKFVSNHAKRNRVAWQVQRDALLNAGWKEQSTNPKYRYVYVLDRKDRILRERIEQMAQPYPKRDHAGA